MIIDSKDEIEYPGIKHVYREYLKGKIIILSIEMANAYLFRNINAGDRLYYKGKEVTPNKTYYLEKEYPCAEAVLRAAAKAYNLTLNEDAFRMLGPFGGGLSVEHLCGAITGGVAFLGLILYKGDKESLEKSKKATVEFYDSMVKYFASELCFDIKKKWRKEEPVTGVKKLYGCLDVVMKAGDLLDSILVNNVENNGVTK